MLARKRQATQTMSQRTQRGLQLASLALLHLYDHDYKAWCPGGHGTSSILCVGRRVRLLWTPTAVRWPSRRRAGGCGEEVCQAVKGEPLG